VFDRFTPRARTVIVLSQAEARLLRHDYIGTEHLLLALLQEPEGIAAQALEALGIDFDAVRARAVQAVGEGITPPTGHIPFTPRVKHVLELALRESIALGHPNVGTEHLLLGMLRDEDGVGARVLIDDGVTLAVARQEVVGLLATREFSKQSQSDARGDVVVQMREARSQHPPAGEPPAG
jgi:ATP-dependent Clp protease ATP-binding subunit ClpC